MKVNIKQVAQGGKPFEVTARLDLSGLHRWGTNPIPDPVEVKAVLRNQNGIVTAEYTADYLLKGMCARCLSAVEQPGKVEMRHTLVEEVADEKNDAFLLVPDGVLDLLDLVWADISLALEDVLLCSESCKGLCPVCGGDRNQTECACAPQRESSPFHKLLDFTSSE